MVDSPVAFGSCPAFNSNTIFFSLFNICFKFSNNRNTPELRTNLIYQKFSAPFLKTFSEHQEALEECLGKIEEIASAMDTVKRNVSIVSVSTGTVGIAGGVLCIIGLVLTPVTLGVSSILSIVGTAVGAGAGVGDLVTNITEGACNAVKKNKVEEILNKYKKTIEPIDESLRKQELVFNKVSEILGLGKAAVNMADDIANLTRIGDTVSDGAAVGLRGTGTGALKIMGGVGSSVFIVWDLYRICTNSISLAKGKKNETAEIIRRTVAELRRELQSYKHLYEVLQKGKEDPPWPTLIPQPPAALHEIWSPPQLGWGPVWPLGGAVSFQQPRWTILRPHPEVQLATGDQAPGALLGGL
uniref:Apolipoprotein L3 n=1 Tax=Erpetoichthys calabaricus TaxID=27687 RepID=A0A8C4SH68_ERPCA